MKYKTATGNALLRAYGRAAKRIDHRNNKLIATEESAGFIMPNDFPVGEGWQVFVRLVRFSEKLLRDKPDSGGLLQ